MVPEAFVVTEPHHAEGLGRAAFTCLGCGRRVSLPVDAELASKLVERGARCQIPTRDADDRPPNPDAPALTYDDLLDLHELLQREDWFEQLLSLSW